MMRRDAIRALGGYDATIRYAQDYDLWTRVVMGGEQIAILPARLLRYRWTAGQISRAKQEEQHQCALAIAQRYITWLINTPVTMEETSVLWRLNVPERLPMDTIRQGIALAQRIVAAIALRWGNTSARLAQQSLDHLLCAQAEYYASRNTRISMLCTYHALRNAPSSLYHWSWWKQCGRMAKYLGRAR